MKKVKKNELEKLLLMAELGIKTLKEQRFDTPGLVFDKGTPEESKLRFDTGLAGIKALRDLFGVDGAFSLGICKTCTKFNTDAHGNKNFGDCRGGKGMKHIYDSCGDHSIKGGGYGI